jgi:hypothetical protein
MERGKTVVLRMRMMLVRSTTECTVSCDTAASSGWGAAPDDGSLEGDRSLGTYRSAE